VNTLVMETASQLRPTLGEHVEIEAMLEETGGRRSPIRRN
jgi:hypothetical protein